MPKHNFLDKCLKRKLRFYYVIAFIIILAFIPKVVRAVSSETITSSTNFNAGLHNNTEATSKEGELKLKGDGTWTARAWRTPYLTLNDGTAFATDDTYTYMLVSRDLRFVKYIPNEDRWQALTSAPHMPYSGADMVILGDYIYVTFGGYQKVFSRYSISANTWTDLTDLPDFVFTGSSIQTDGTNLYILRGGNTIDFWKYTVSSGLFSTLSGPPASISAGGDLIFDDSLGTDYLYTPRGANTLTFYRYDISANTWATMANAPATLSEDGNITKSGDYIYVLRGVNTTTFYRYRISTNVWSTISATPSTTRYVGVIYNTDEDLIYVFRGNNTYDWWKYDPDTDTFAGPTELPNTPGSGADIIYGGGGNIYFRRGNNSTSFYSYNITTGGTWPTLAVLPASSNDDTKGVRASTDLYYFRGSNTNAFYSYSITDASWATMNTAPSTVNYGASLAYLGSGDYIYGTRGGLTTTFWRYSISGDSWSDTAVADLPSGGLVGYGGRLVSDSTAVYAITGSGIGKMYKYTIGTDTWSLLGTLPFAPYWGTDIVYYNGKIYAQSGYYRTDFWEYTISTNTWRKLPDMAGYYAYDVGPYNGGSLAVNSDNGQLYTINGTNIYRMMAFTPSSFLYPTSGTWQSDSLDLSYVSSWDGVSSSSSAPSDSDVTLETRSSTDKVTWDNWESVSGDTIGSTAARYIQIRATLDSSTDRTETPTLYSVSVNYNGDSTAPTNPSLSTATSQSVGGVSLTSGGTYRYSNPYFTWSGATDSQSSVSGYYVYFGTSASGDPETAGTYQTGTSYTVTSSMSTGTYYLRLQTKDSAGNVSSAVTLFTYVYGGVSPGTAVSYTLSSDFSSGSVLGASTANDQIQLLGKTGFWQQSRLSLIPAGAGLGAGFAYVSSTGKLYTFRGQNTTSFYEYDISTDTWTTKGVAPETVYQGGEMVEGPSGYLYGFPGKNTTKFWRYDISDDEWSDAEAADAPLALYYGSAMIYDGSQYIYVLRGNSDDSFMKYDTSSDTWETLTNVDFGSPTNQINNNVYVGGDLTYDGSDTIYAIQGNALTGFSSYSIASNSWTVLPNLPILPYDGSQISYESTSNAIYYLSGWSNPFIYKYSLATQTWAKLNDAPLPLVAGAAMKSAGGNLYILRGGNTTTFWKYNISKGSWQVPNVGLFGTEFRGTDYRPFGYGVEIVKGAGNYYYLVRGNYDNLFIRYDASSGETVRMADAPGGFYIGSSMVYDTTTNKIYAVPSQYIQNLYVYDVATNTWSEETSDAPPVASVAGSSMAYDGSQYIYWLRGGSNNFYRFDTQGSSGSKWSSALAGTPVAVSYGAELVYVNGYIYTPRGSNTLSFYRYDVNAGTWSDPLVADLPTGGTIYNDGFLVKAGSDSLIACRGGNQVGCYQYTISANTWATIDNAPANIYQGGAAAGDGSTRIYVVAGNGTNTFADGLYSYIIGSSTTAFEESGSFTSSTHDLTSTYKYANVTVVYSVADNTGLTVETRTSDDDVAYNSWTEATEVKSLGTTYTYKVNSSAKRYMQVRFTLTSTDGVYSGAVDSYSIQFYSDSAGPTNPTTLSSYNSNLLGSTINSNNWYSSTAPYFSWPAEDAAGGATDTSTGSGISGYYVYFGTNQTAVPSELGTLTTNIYYSPSSMISGSTYYLRMQTLDNAANLSSSTQPYIYKFDNTVPQNVTTITADPPGYTATNSFTFSWTAGTDSESGIAGYCYKTGATGATETCTTETTVAGIEGYQTGANVFYIRAKDNAQNYASDYVTTSYYYSSVAPGAPQDLDVDPSSNTVNEFAFTWEPPTLYYGAQSGLRYYYSVNALPTSSNVNAVGLEVTYLTAAAYATQNGSNNFYVVAKDEAGNIDYGNYASIEFTADTSAPGIPLNAEIADVSVKETSSWKLAISWEPPTDSGSGLSIYKVYRSITASASCTGDFDDFTYISSTTGKSYVDTDLTQQYYYYCVKACTSTNVCSAPSDTVSFYPDGRWKVAPSLAAEPEASVKTKSSTITWSTGRKGSSFVKYGKSSGSYGEEVGSSELVTSHEIDLTGLDPGTTYHYKVLWTDEDGNTGESDEYTFDTNAAPFVSDVKISNISLYEAYISFTVKNATKATMQYGKSISYGGVETVSTSKSESSYTIKLTSLTDGTVYHLRVVAEDEEENTYNGDDYTFETLPVPKISGLRIQQVEGVPTATLRLLWKSNTRLSSIVTYYPSAKPELTKDAINLTPKTNHEMVLRDLIDETEYIVLVKGKDSAGNEGKAENKTVKTSADLRAPEINNANVESTIVGVGEEARAQIIVTWDTDEPSTSQIEYGEGTTGQYVLSTQEDTNLTSNHSVTIPGLTPSKIYHLRIISKDKNKNVGYSQDIVVITPSATADALNLVVNKLSKTFGFLKKAKVK